MLADRTWSLKYTPEHGDLVEQFYIPALEDAERYDRLTGYFNARALTLAARGIESLVRNDGRMRLVAGCTLEPPEIEAIEKGEQLRALVERRLADLPLAPPDPISADALELLAWMVARGFLDIKVAVPCDDSGKPIPADGIFHEKTGIIEDRTGDKIAWTGSLNETAAGWRNNWETISVYTSWGPEPGRVDQEEVNFARIWASKARRVIVLDVPDAARRDLMRFMPASDKPARLKGRPQGEPKALPPEQPNCDATIVAEPIVPQADDLRNRVWSFVRRAPSLPDGGDQVGEATSAVTPWPHQIRAFDRLYGAWPPRLLIADEVGLGKTIQAGMLLRQAWLAGYAKRILVLAPKAVLGQWQIELREKFNLNWPIYDRGKLIRYPSPAWRGRNERDVGRDNWHRESAVLASSHLMRRHDRAAVLLEEAEPWDLVVLDEAHHARRRGAGSRHEGGPNALLRLMQGLKNCTQGLVLLTATPMQVHPVELWDLLNLLNLPPEWTDRAFLKYFDDIEQPNPSPEALDRLARLFRSTEHAYGEVETKNAQRLVDLSPLKTNKILRALRNNAGIPRRQLETEERRAALAILRANTPVSQLVSRHTRELLRRYFRAGLMATPVADRHIEDRFLEMTEQERALYDAVEDFIASTYNQSTARERTAVGFVMTIYRRRLASSFGALRKTLQRHRDAIDAGETAHMLALDEDVPDDETLDDILDADDATRLQREVLVAEEEADVEGLLADIDGLPPDSKLGSLNDALRELRQEGYTQAMVFTQYTDTMDFLRGELLKNTDASLMCFSGRGGEIPAGDGSWRRIGRDDAKRRFRDQQADVLLCTDAAAEGLNFQFCGALINYDMPWNPMRVEQRIGRIDRLGQENRTIRIVNLHYEGTVESDVYRAVRNRIGLFESVVGRLQPILAQLPRTISQSVLSGENRDPHQRANLVDAIEREAQQREERGFDIDRAAQSDLAMPTRPPCAVTMEDLDRIIGSAGLMPPGVDVQALGHREYGLLAPGMTDRLRVTTDPQYFQEHAESMELWSPGNALFVPPEFTAQMEDPPKEKTLKDILDG